MGPGMPLWIIVIILVILVMISTLIDNVSRSIDRLTKVLKENRDAEPRGVDAGETPAACDRAD